MRNKSKKPAHREETTPDPAWYPPARPEAPAAPLNVNESWRLVSRASYSLNCCGNGMPGDQRKWADGCEKVIPRGAPYAEHTAPYNTKHCERCVNTFLPEATTPLFLFGEKKDLAVEASLTALRTSLRGRDPLACAVEVDPLALERALRYLDDQELLIQRLRRAMDNAVRELSWEANRKP